MSTPLDSKAWEAALPDMSSPVTIDGIENTIRIWRDSYGIPHVQASSRHDAFFGQGFVHAQDRLWQMDWDRRRAYGRTAELTGTPGLVNDRFARRMVLGDSARADFENFNDETRGILESYAAGVNAFINSGAPLPVEFEITGTTPEAWQPWDGCAIYKIRHVLMATGMGKLWKARIYRALGPEMATMLRSEGQGDEVLVVPPGAEHVGSLKDFSELDAGIEALSRLFDMDGGSNNWAIDGTKTASGKPLMAGDPHRALDVPSVYYQNHLACPEFDVVGMSFNGVPGFPHFGHNQHVAWCITHATADYQDIYVEKFDPADPTRYEYKGEMLQAEHRIESIPVKDGDPVDVTITITRNGPVIFGEPANGYALSLRYSATDKPNECFHALLPMLKTTTVDEYEEAMRCWVDPANNLITIDTAGSISYLTRGRIPVRDISNAWLPVPGWTGDHDWHGDIPFEELPRSRNPETGYVATANNRIVGKDYPHYIALDFAPPGRARRIVDRLSEISNATVADMESIHADRISTISRFFVDRIAAVEPTDAGEREAVEMLNAWDGGMDLDSVAASIYTAIRDAIIRIVIDQPPMESLKTTPFGGEPAGITLGVLLWWQIPGVIRENDTTMLGEGVTWNDVFAQAITQGLARLTELAGPDKANWTWGAIHRTAPLHPLAGAFPDLRDRLNPPSTGIGGDGDTPQAASILPGAHFNVAATSVARYVFDAADWNNCRWIVPIGASGHPGSPHWADQVELWSSVQTIPMLYDWDQIQADAETSQELRPKG